MFYFHRFRTVINVLGDSLGAGIVAHLTQREIGKAKKCDLNILGDELNKIG